MRITKEMRAFLAAAGKKGGTARAKNTTIEYRRAIGAIAGTASAAAKRAKKESEMKTPSEKEKLAGRET